MENFFYKGEFFKDLDEFIDTILDYTETVKDLPETYEAICYKSSEEPILTLSSEWITKRICDDRISENEVEKITDILNKYLDFEKVNQLIPKLYYEAIGNRIIITKKDLIEWMEN